MRWISVVLQENEREALITLARQERRDPRDQAAVILRQELERRGLLPSADQHAQTQVEVGREVVA